jgi:6-phosphogluconolactonase (cycloisomerase 2 family)
VTNKFRILRLVGPIGLVAVLLLAAGCGNPSPTNPSPTNTYVYVAQYQESLGTSLLRQFQLSGSGTLTEIGALQGAGRNLAVDSREGFLFSGDGPIQQYVITNDGVVTPNSIPAIEIEGTSFGLTYVSACNCVIGANNVTEFSIGSWSVGPSGSLASVSNVQTGGNSAAIVAVHPSGRFAFVPSNVYNDEFESTTTTISEFSIGQDGALTPANSLVTPGVAAGANFVTSPKGFLYVEKPYTATAIFSVDPDSGALSMTGTTAIPTASYFAFDPTGNYAYLGVTEGGTPALARFSVDPNTGALTPDGPAFNIWIAPGEQGLWAVDPSARFLVVSNYAGPNFAYQLSILAIGNDGSLSLASNLALPANTYPVAITFAQK